VPLLDHFHPPLSSTRHWESFHAAWATEIMRTLNRHVLPPGCFAEAQVHVGSRVEIDVATFEREGGAAAAANGNCGGNRWPWDNPCRPFRSPSAAWRWCPSSWKALTTRLARIAGCDE